MNYVPGVEMIEPMRREIKELEAEIESINKDFRKNIAKGHDKVLKKLFATEAKLEKKRLSVMNKLAKIKYEFMQAAILQKEIKNYEKKLKIRDTQTAELIYLDMKLEELRSEIEYEKTEIKMKRDIATANIEDIERQIEYKDRKLNRIEKQFKGHVDRYPDGPMSFIR